MGKPFIKLLHTINAGYFYDVNRNQLVDISEESYQYLQDLLADKEVGTEPEEITYLRQSGYLSDHHVEKIEHPYSQYLEDMLNRNCRKITLQVTQNCNFRCRYCVYSNDNQNSQRHHSNKVMTEETAFKAIDFLAEHSVDTSEVNIGFYGGEPLLNFDLIKKCINYAHDRFAGKECSFSMTTNASLLSEEVIDFLVKNDVNLLISFDGPKVIQDANRIYPGYSGSTYDLVRNKILLIKVKYPNYYKKISINMVIDPKFDFDLVCSLQNDPVFEELNLNISPLDDEYTPEKLFGFDRYVESYNYQVFLSYLVWLKKIKSVHFAVTRSMLNSIKHAVEYFIPKSFDERVSAPSGPCIPGQSRLFITVDGILYPCERVNETAYCLQIGNLDDGFNYTHARKLLNIGCLTETYCKECWAFSLCKICARAAEKDGEWDSDHKISHCHKIKDNAIGSLMELLLLREATEYYEC